jgi:DNA-binding CsgD family transcriptional regulator
MDATLTSREIDVVRLLAEGCTYGRVAERLGISEHTVCSHIKNLYRKLDVHTAAAAVFRALPLFEQSLETMGASHDA